MIISGNPEDYEIEVLEYPACPGEEPPPAWETGDENQEEESAQSSAKTIKDSLPVASAAGWNDEQLAEEKRRAFEAGREQGREQGRQEGRQAASNELAAARSAEQAGHKQQLARLIESFAVEHERFLLAVEQETVKLALAIAARILRREAQMDPLLLTGAVRVALGQLAGTAEVQLRVPAGEIELWKETIAAIPNLALKPEIVAGEGMHTGDCVIESKVGTVDLGIRTQLGEIERGFFDRARSSGNGAAEQKLQTVGEPA
jgi:flagellar assembly protein FliH